MALTADREYKTLNPTEILKILAGAGDTLYKGAIMAVGADGYVCVPSDGANIVPLGLCKEQVVALGSHVETVEIETGKVLVAKKSQHQSTVLCGAGGASNVNYDGAYFLVSDGETTYYVWTDVAAGSDDPGDEGGPLEGLGYTGIEVDILTTTTVGDIALAIETAVELATDIDVTVDTATCTFVASTRGYSIPSEDEGDAVPFTVTNTLYGGAVQADIGELFYAIADDGVIYASEKSTITACLGLCVDKEGTTYLYIDTLKKALS